MRIVRRRGDLIISETRHGFVCANAGIDLSNVDDGWAALLPVDSDRSARAHPRRAARAGAASTSAVIVSDTFGRPWRHGLTDVAIGVSGIAAVVDLRDTRRRARPRCSWSPRSRSPTRSRRAAELVMGKAASVPAAIVRGLDPAWFGEGSVRELVRPPHEDLFR